MCQKNSVAFKGHLMNMILLSLSVHVSGVCFHDYSPHFAALELFHRIQIHYSAPPILLPSILTLK